MNKKIKKGFTIVELVIVIAIIGVLSAILIPTFTGLVNSAREAADINLVKNLNTALTTDAVINGKHETAYDAIHAANESGYSVEKLTPTSFNYDIIWDKSTDRFILVNGDEYKFFDETTTPSRNKKDLWKIYKLNQLTAESTNEDSYCIYLSGNEEIENLVITTSFDAGENVINNLEFNTKEKIEVTVVTKNGGNLVVDAPNATVNHYGVLEDLTIQRIYKESYHEFGKVLSKLTLNHGHLVAESYCEINNLIVNVAGTSKTDINVKEYAKVNRLVIENATTDNFEMTVANADQISSISGESADTVTANITNGNNQTVTIHKHSGVLHPKIPATCTESGIIAYYICDCGKLFSDEELNNEISESELVIEKLDHIIAIDPEKPATCIEEGLSQGSHCSLCNEVIDAQTILEKIDHIFDNDHVCTMCQSSLANQYWKTIPESIEIADLKTLFSNGGNIKLNNDLDITGCKELKITTNTVINLAGHKISGLDQSDFISASGNINVTIMNGEIETEKKGTSSYPVIKSDKANLTLDNMHIVCNTKDTYVISSSSDGGTVNIKNSTVIAKNGYALFTGSQSKIIVENSEIDGNINIQENSSVTLNSGKFNIIRVSSGGSNGILTINGGTFVNSVDNFGAYYLSQPAFKDNRIKIKYNDSYISVKSNGDWKNYVVINEDNSWTVV